jgi:hypothetical protein
MFGALVALIVALRQALDAWGKLAASEGRVALASLPLLFGAGLALVALGLSLWAVLVAWAAWALLQLTQSPEAVLGSLVVIHVVLGLLVWACFRYLLRQVTFRRARRELRTLAAAVASAAARDSRTVGDAPQGRASTDVPPAHHPATPP